MDDYKKVYSKQNLVRAWKWINSNPSAQYKNYFRDSYTAYAISVEENIGDLYNRLKNNKYIPNKPSKVLLPKTICTTRLYTLLTIEDQIVYQAFINVIAENYSQKAKHRYNKTVFGNLYSGKRSIWFYRKWDLVYANFNRALKSTYNNGYEYIASFDLTACYDSIDHKVLGIFLKKYGLDKEFIDKLLILLNRWSTNHSIYKSHGIPQGPMSSGILSEVILSYFDESYEKLNKSDEVKYFRYVDDIKLMARDKLSLKRMLARLDYNCKQIGLFPQSSKIEIHKIIDIKNEIKNISSLGDELSKLSIKGNYKLIEKNLIRLCKNGKVNNLTEFKMYLFNAKANAKLSNKLLDVLENNPQLFESISNYFKSYTTKISDKIVDRLITEFEKPEIYQIVNAHLIDAISNNLSNQNNQKLMKFVLTRWKERRKRKLNPTYRNTLLSYLFKNNLIKYKGIKQILINENDWWVKKTIIKYIDLDFIGEPSYIELNKILLTDECVDISLAAVFEIIKNNCNISPPYSEINYIGQKALKFVGIINRSASRPSLIGNLLDSICDKKLPCTDWKKIFGKDHDLAENKIVRTQAYVQNDMSAFVNITDVFNDFLLSKLFVHDTTLGGYKLGNIGGSLNKGTRLEKQYPELFLLCKEIHNKRLECDLSHSITKSTNKQTRPIEYKYIYKARKSLYEGYKNIIEKW
ncbi:RNA-directed DNA polymerase [Clostridium sp.]|uniref:RNA-directed DNA polymerase n=1 Tax=Clostridium sp. TaxID=1506 RepID=UPI002638D072|nr:RNA-directed DNA polymerase [uncultured Clostridium sp.]